MSKLVKFYVAKESKVFIKLIGNESLAIDKDK